MRRKAKTVISNVLQIDFFASWRNNQTSIKNLTDVAEVASVFVDRLFEF